MGDSGSEAAYRGRLDADGVYRPDVLLPPAGPSDRW